MIRRIFLVLGITTVIAGLAPIANAQSASSSNSNNSSVTLSGQSLRSVENRSISGDFQTFFSGTSQGGEYPVETNVGRLTQSPSKSPIGNGIEVIFDDTLNSSTPFTYPNSGDTNDSRQVRLQINQQTTKSSWDSTFMVYGSLFDSHEPDAQEGRRELRYQL